MINNRPYLFYDFETGCTNGDTTQPLSLAAVMIDPRKLSIIPNSLFSSFIKPYPEEEVIKRGLSPITKGALNKNKIKLEDLEEFPHENIVIDNFANWTYQWNIKKDSWGAPISCGFRNTKFDIKIINRLCKSYGYWDEKKNQQKIFSPVDSLDLYDMLWIINENNPEIDAGSMDAIRAWLNIPTDGAHSAIVDVEQGATLFCKMMRYQRYWSSKTTFKWEN